MTDDALVRPRAPEREVGYVLDEFDAGRDPLGLSAHDDPGVAAPDVVSGALAGADTATSHRIVAALARRRIDTVASLDELTAKLMAHIGIDPLVLVWLSSISAELAAAHDADGATMAEIDLTSQHDDDSSLTSVEIGGDVTWFSHGTLSMPPIPEALATAVTGGPLSALLSHPMLDGHPFTVSSIETTGDRSTVVVRYDDQWIEIRAVTTAMLAEMMTKDPERRSACATI